MFDLLYYQSPFDASLLHRSLKTLPIRMERHSTNAMQVAKFLEQHSKVSNIDYAISVCIQFFTANSSYTYIILHMEILSFIFSCYEQSYRPCIDYSP